MELTYNGTVYRPPTEWATTLIPTTEGCSHNGCAFCNMYRDVHFRMLTLDEMRAWLQAQAAQTPDPSKVDRIYLVGADPFALSYDRLAPRVDLVYEYFPHVQVVSMYARADNVTHKSDRDLERLANLGVGDLYMGTETGLDDVLEHLNKGFTLAEAKEQLIRLNAAGISHRDLLMLGSAGRGRGEEEALATAALENEVKPDALLVNTMSVFDGTGLAQEVREGSFELASEEENLREERTLIEHLADPDLYFWAAHPLDSLTLAGYLRDGGRERMVAQIDGAIAHAGGRHVRRMLGRDATL